MPPPQRRRDRCELSPCQVPGSHGGRPRSPTRAHPGPPSPAPCAATPRSRRGRVRFTGLEKAANLYEDRCPRRGRPVRSASTSGSCRTAGAVAGVPRFVFLVAPPPAPRADATVLRTPSGRYRRTSRRAVPGMGLLGRSSRVVVPPALALSPVDEPTVGLSRHRWADPGPPDAQPPAGPAVRRRPTLLTFDSNPDCPQTRVALRDQGQLVDPMRLRSNEQPLRRAPTPWTSRPGRIRCPHRRRPFGTVATAGGVGELALGEDDLAPTTQEPNYEVSFSGKGVILLTRGRGAPR